MNEGHGHQLVGNVESSPCSPVLTYIPCAHIAKPSMNTGHSSFLQSNPTLSAGKFETIDNKLLKMTSDHLRLRIAY